MEWHQEEFRITTDPAAVSLDTVHRFLSTEAYWAKGIAREIVEKSIANSLCFSILHGANQVGYARVISDRATIAYLGDVFVLKEYRGRGLSKWLMQCVTSHPDLQGLRRWMLVTGDAHEIYAQFGFTPLKSTHSWMERHDPEVYERGTYPSATTIKV